MSYYICIEKFYNNCDCKCSTATPHTHDRNDAEVRYQCTLAKKNVYCVPYKKDKPIIIKIPKELFKI